MPVEPHEGRRASIRIQPGEPIHGWIAAEGGRCKPFHGWFELAAHLQALAAEAPLRPGEAEEEPKGS